jgi:hypothetical protein
MSDRIAGPRQENRTGTWVSNRLVLRRRCRPTFGPLRDGQKTLSKTPERRRLSFQPSDFSLDSHRQRWAGSISSKLSELVLEMPFGFGRHIADPLFLLGHLLATRSIHCRYRPELHSQRLLQGTSPSSPEGQRPRPCLGSVRLVLALTVGSASPWSICQSCSVTEQASDAVPTLVQCDTNQASFATADLIAGTQ